MNINKICFFSIYPAHYRKAIFTEMAYTFGVDFYFGDKMKRPPKRIDDESIPGFKSILNNNIFLWPLYWQHGVIPLLFKHYSLYITMGNIWCVSTWFFLILGRLFTNKTFILWSHGWYGNESFLKKLLKKRFFSLAHEIFVYGDYSKNMMLQNGFRSHNIHVIYNSLDYDHQIKQRLSLSKSDLYVNQFKNNNPNLIFIGRLNPVKKLDLVINAIQYLIEKFNFFVNFTFIGDGEMRLSLSDMVLNTNLSDHVWFFGDCYDEDKISELIFNADLCVSPGNIGLTAMHSMVYGTPVLTHNNYSKQVPEFEAIIDGQNGCFFEFNSFISLAGKIKQWLEYSSQNREGIRECCYQVIDNKYNPHIQVNIFKQVLSKYIGLA